MPPQPSPYIYMLCMPLSIHSCPTTPYGAALYGAAPGLFSTPSLFSTAFACAIDEGSAYEMFIIGVDTEEKRASSLKNVAKKAKS